MDARKLDYRSVIAYSIVGILLAIFCWQYLRAIGPAAQREHGSPCVALRPTLYTPNLGKLPHPAPEMTAADQAGHKQSLSQYRGRVVLLNFWAPWCPPCLEEWPTLEAIQRAFLPDNVVVLGIAQGSRWPDIQEKFPHGTNVKLLLDDTSELGQVGQTARRFGTRKLPESYLIDKNGNVRFYFVNKRDWEQPAAHACVRSLVNE